MITGRPMGQKLPWHMMDARTLRAFAAGLEAQARQLVHLAEELERQQAVARRRGEALRAYQEARRGHREAARASIVRLALEKAPAATLAAETGLPLRTVQRIKRDVTPR